MLQRVRMPDPERRLDQYPHEFSGGMRQRIAIAMALMAEPALLIADEPTTALDATLELATIELLKTLQREIGCAILFVSHHLGVVAELCDRVNVMYAGEVVETGDIRSVFQQPAPSLYPAPARLRSRADGGAIAPPARPFPGDLPDLVSLPTGCVFAERCPAVFEPCRRGAAAMIDRCLATAPRAATSSARRRVMSALLEVRDLVRPLPAAERSLANLVTGRSDPDRRRGRRLLRHGGGRDLRLGGGIRLRQDDAWPAPSSG